MPANVEKRYLERLQILKGQFSHAALTKPKDKSDFGFGEACGTYLGLLKAEQLFREVIGEEDDKP